MRFSEVRGQSRSGVVHPGPASGLAAVPAGECDRGDRTPATIARAQRAGLWLAARDYRGWDPYDGLTTPLARLPALRSRRHLRFALQQIVKRSPINLRPVLRIPPGRNAVTLALSAQAHSYLAHCAPSRHKEHTRAAHALVEAVAALRSSGWSGSCWGYDFDWQARRVALPAGYPTVVATGMVTNALFEVDRLLTNPHARELVIDAFPFLATDLRRTYDPDGSFCWSYSPKDQQIVLNATMKAARLCAQVSQLTGDREPLGMARSTVAFVARRQRPDGSWPYAEGDGRPWTDNFHTGYILDCLHACAQAGVETATPTLLQNGLRFYCDNFFGPDGAPFYYPGRPRPIDATACAQSLLTLCTFGEIKHAHQVAAWTMKYMDNQDGSFAYRVSHRRTDRTPFSRWSVAWLFCALARLGFESC